MYKSLPPDFILLPDSVLTNYIISQKTKAVKALLTQIIYLRRLLHIFGDSVQ